MGPSLAVEGARSALVLEAYVERVLAPSLHEGQIVIMDNLGAHRPKRIRELIEERGCELLYLPSYSPDYNPIEEAFAKIKNLLRKAAARTREALVEAIGAALSAVSAADIRGFFEHAGYHTTGHLLWNVLSQVSGPSNGAEWENGFDVLDQRLIHRSAWKGFSPKSIRSILHSEEPTTG
jgi:transposase